MVKVGIKLDFDKKIINVRQFRRRLFTVAEILDFTIQHPEVLESRRGFHVSFTAVGQDLLPQDAVIIQSCLGSDAVREALNWRRIKNGFTLEEANLLFTEKRRVEIVNGKIVKEKLLGLERSTWLSRFYLQRLFCGAPYHRLKTDNSDDHKDLEPEFPHDS